MAPPPSVSTSLIACNERVEIHLKRLLLSVRLHFPAATKMQLEELESEIQYIMLDMKRNLAVVRLHMSREFKEAQRNEICLACFGLQDSIDPLFTSTLEG